MKKHKMVRQVLQGLLVTMFAVLTSACQTMGGQFVGESKDYMPMLFIFNTSEQALTEAEYMAAQDVAESMGVKLDQQISSAGESMLITGAAYGGATAPAAATQSWFYPGASNAAAAGWTGIVNAAAGSITGLANHSFARVNALGNMTELALRDRERNCSKYPKYMVGGECVLRGLHATAAFVRSRNNHNAPAPEVVNQWRGAPAGSYTQ